MSSKSLLNPISTLILLLGFLSFIMCNCSKVNEREDKLIGTKINFMQHAVKLHNIDTSHAGLDFESEFKIVTYADLYCHPCWQSILPWKAHLVDFKQYSNLSFICYVNAMPSDFDKENEKTKLSFPVLLDYQNRFRVVNRLGNNPNRLTFLLNKNNEIILVGQPFTPDIKQKYIDIITGKN